MNRARVLKALGASIQHWRAVDAGRSAAIGAKDCALCRLFGCDCLGCPLADYGEGCPDERSAYLAVVAARGADRPAWYGVNHLLGLRDVPRTAVQRQATADMLTLLLLVREAYSYWQRWDAEGGGR